VRVKNGSAFVAQAILPARYFGALVMGAHSQDWLCHVNLRRRQKKQIPRFARNDIIFGLGLDWCEWS
jgi:hypothetical protein